MKNRLTTLIIVMSAIYIFIIPAFNLSTSLIVLFKLIPMVLIIIYGFKQRKSGKGRLVMTGLIICAAADAAIAYSFILGLIIFLIGHVFYILAFSQSRRFGKKPKLLISLVVLYMIVMGYFIVAALVEANDTTMMLPVSVYILVIGAMGITAMCTCNKWAIIGATLFIISDSVLAWNRFVDPITSANFWIMTTYYGAQYFIAKSKL